MIKVNKALKIVIVATTFGLGLVGGVVTQNILNTINTNKVSNNARVAIVNLDEGTFANKLLTKQATDIELTGYRDALDGVKKGKYNSYIVVPADFSKNVTSINNNPKSSILKYELNQNLDSTNKEEVYSKVMKIKENLNDGLGLIYIDEILKSFHKGQDSAQEVLNNNKKIKEVLASINTPNMSKLINIEEAKFIKNDIKDLNIENEINKNKKLVGNIKDMYQLYLTKMGQEKLKIGNQFWELTTIQNKINDNINQLVTPLNERNQFNFAVIKSKEVVEKYNTSLESIKNDLLKFAQDNQQNFNLDDEKINQDYNDEISLHLLESKINKELLNYIATNMSGNKKFTDILKEAETNHNLQLLLKEYINKTKKGTTNYTIINYYNEQNDLKKKSEDFKNKEAIFTTKITQVKEKIAKQHEQLINSIIAKTQSISKLNFDDVNNGYIADVKSFDEEQKKNKTKLIENQSKLHSEFNKGLQNLIKFDPQSFVKQTELEHVALENSTSNDNLKSKVLTNNHDYVDYAQKVATDAQKQLNNQHNNALSQKTSVTNELNHDLSLAKKVSIESSDLNNQLLMSFISKLKNTRDASNNSENLNVLNLINHPLQDEFTNVEHKTANKFEPMNNNILLIVIFMSFLGLGTLFVIIKLFLKN